MADKPTYEELEQRVKELETEAAQREQLDRADFYQAVLDGIINGVWVSDKDDVIYYTNKGMETIAGIPKQQILGSRVLRDFPESTLDHFAPHYIKAKETLQPIYYDAVPVVTPADRQSYQSGWLIPRVEDGSFGGMICTVDDITERKLLESELFLKNTVFEMSVAANSTADRDGVINHVNPAFLKMWGYETKEEAIGHRVRHFFQNQNDAVSVIEALNASGMWEGEFVAKRKDGSTFISRGFATAVQDEEGHQIGYYSTNLDVTEEKRAEAQIRELNATLEERVTERTAQLAATNEQLRAEAGERKRTEEALRQSEVRYRTLVENIDLGITLIDKDHTILMTNRAQGELFKKSPSDFVGKKCFREFEHREKICKHCSGTQAMRTGQPSQAQTEGILDDGSRFSADIYAFPFIEEDGEISGFIEVVRDITEIKRAEEEKKELEAKLQQAQQLEAIGTLAGGIAHDFNNLLMSVQSNAFLVLVDIDSTHPHYEPLANIKDLVKSGAELTRQLLGYARKGRYYVKPLNLNQLVEKMSETIRRTRKDIVIDKDLTEDLLPIEADQGQIGQVLMNLLVNASDAMPVGGDLRLRTANMTHKDMEGKLFDPRPGNYVQLTVTDTGKGMDKETLERIFEPFYTTKEMGRGTGLGLASTYGIIKGHGGYIDVESEKERGTTFTVYFPATKKQVEEAVRPSEEIIKGTETILMIDDEERILKAGVMALKRLGYTVLEAESGEEAVEIYRENKDRIDLVILDMVMPHMGGREAFDKMKEINPKVKVLLSSGYSIDSQAKEILERGCNAFIQKPFGMRDLSHRIREVLEKE